ncbi:MAG: radical SAM protein, partial [Oscillospiraceae bacterium]
MLICGLQKLSLLDYPEKLAATIFTGGCNYRCPFCHNASLVNRVSECSPIPEAEVLEFLGKRTGKLDGVCITGGEPLLWDDLADFITEVRRLGFLVKLDT